MDTLNCEFSDPVNYLGLPASEDEIWNWQKVACSEAGMTEITDGNYTAYISSKVDFGDIFVIGFLILFIGALIFKFLWDFVNPRIVKIKGQQD